MKTECGNMLIKIDNSEVVYKRERPKSIGNSVTLPSDIRDKDELEKVLFALTEQVTYRLRKEKLLANVVNVQLRTKDFVDFSHQKRLETPISNTKEIYAEAKMLLNEMYKQGMAIRLVGVRTDNLVQKNELQLSLFNNSDNEKQDKIDNTIDKLKEKYGYDFITRASNLNLEDTVKIRRKD